MASEYLPATGTGMARVYACDTCGPIDDLLALARTRVTRSLTATERQQYLHE